MSRTVGAGQTEGRAGGRRRLRRAPLSEGEANGVEDRSSPDSRWPGAPARTHGCKLVGARHVLKHGARRRRYRSVASLIAGVDRQAAGVGSNGEVLQVDPGVAPGGILAAHSRRDSQHLGTHVVEQTIVETEVG